MDNGGSGSAAYDANVMLIDSPIVFTNSGVSTVFDLQRSGDVTVRGGDIEPWPSNTTATVLIPGTGTVFEGVWVEAPPGSTLVSPQRASDGLSNFVTFRNNMIWGSCSFTIPSWSSDWTITGNEPAANLAVTDLGTNDLVQYGATANTVRSLPVAFSALPSCSPALEGSMRALTNSNAQTTGATITEGGSYHVLAYCDGTQWTVAAP